MAIARLGQGQPIATTNLKEMNVMQAALAVRKTSINSIAATLAVLVALTAGGAGGYWLKGQAAPQAATISTQPAVPGEMQQVAPFHDMPEQPGSVGGYSFSRTGD